MKQQLNIKILSNNATHEFLRIVKAVAKIQKVTLELEVQKVPTIDTKRRKNNLKSYKKALDRLDDLNFDNIK